jgi:anti-sigma B factor antagonist
MVKTDKQGNITIARVEGTDKITAVNADSIKSELNQLFSDSGKKVALNLKNIEFVDSSGFACFLSAMKTANNNYGDFKIYNINSEVLRLFQLLHLDSVFEICENEEECLASF